jgi:hypothetical protein
MRKVTRILGLVKAIAGLGSNKLHDESGHAVDKVGKR